LGAGPDGRRIVFRSFRDGGGIYTIPVTGGPETLLAPGGFEPRFSPDGGWVAYSAVGQYANGSIYVVPAEGGIPRRIQAQNFSAACPVWTPDGKGLLFRMSESDTKHDWWLASFDPTETGLVSARRIGFSEILTKIDGRSADMYTCPGDWLDREMLFIRNQALYRIPFSATEWKLRPEGGVVLPGPGVGYERDYVRVIPHRGGRRSLVFSQGQTMNHIWAVPLKPHRGGGQEPRQLTHDVSLEHGFDGSGLSVSRDGQFLAFPSYSSGPGRRILLRNLRSGADHALSPPFQAPLNLS
jgi:hypothetical protein